MAAYELTNLISLYTQQGRIEEAEVLMQRVLRIQEPAEFLAHPLVVYLFNGFDTGKTSCLCHLVMSIEKYSQLLLMHTDTLNSKANIYTKQYRHAHAQVLFLRVLTLRENTLGDTHPAVAEALHDFAVCQQAQGNREEAVALYERALVIRKQALGPEHPQTQQTRERYLNLLRDMGREEEAALLC